LAPRRSCYEREGRRAAVTHLSTLPGSTDVARTRSSAATLVRALLAAAAIAFLCAAAVAYVVDEARDGAIGWDFKGTLFEPAHDVASGNSPYPEMSETDLRAGNPPVYPPVFILFVVPLTALPWGAAVVIWLGLLVAAVPLSLWLLDVRDPRCYLVAFLIGPVWVGVAFGNVALLLLPLVACSWAWRDRRPVLAGVALGLAVVAKLYLWPLGFWLLATRRFRALGSAVVSAAATLALAWAAIGFGEIPDYFRLLRQAERVFSGHSYSVATIATGLGFDETVGRVLCLAAAGLAIVFAYRAGRAGRDRSSLALAILASVLGTPIAWPYTFAIVLLPIALAAPRFRGLWLLPAAFLAAEALPRPDPGPIPCCRPEDVPPGVWEFNHAPPGLWPAVGYAVLTVIIVAMALRSTEHPPPDTEAPAVSP
jgi:alpha-1,2-mannosyltransferase